MTIFEARHIGDLAYLISLVRPHVAVVLNIGSAHLGEFGSRQANAEAKGELLGFKESLQHCLSTSIDAR
ncbi:Mur ligase family protein [Streptosporangium sp. 'caverna']|uniref:Mur ligase family protein n=1 Tax=Streptosporangium sp. 'caverna' TaxID=2202249 RepID=UPI000D7D2E24|nr:Mur ligase family protein [Streptosporangium sp. 'caverna']AWS43613.1 hypothetical protein DKM19_21800 [Streptosporangium sp. 'caverna']